VKARIPAYNDQVRWRNFVQYTLMWGIRRTPVPWALKRMAIDLATPKSIVVGTALIPDGEGRYLMLRARYSGRWIPPGGAIHPGENPLDGLLRECREELGRAPAAPRLVGVYTVRRTHNLFLAFHFAPLEGPPALSAEHETYHYTPPPALPWWVREMAQDACHNAPPVFRTLGFGTGDTLGV
jgi:8-oxo-dGTP pyrophosphatase MutT (NUDIX family)